ncbi:MAG: phosphoribosylaminoimidazolesuccinocarboxamide synthase [Bacteroidales bacterium]|nr:phosphoribosylaminoimidazolesuccinocarboxamide synthase [Bacteroidales bacterium]
MTNTLEKFESPQLKKIHAGKVRDSIRIDDKKRMIVVTDRISAFNKNLKNSAIPHKGAVLNTLTNFWFEKTKHIIPNHFIEQIDDNISIVKECQPIKVEMIVRAYITGSMWRGYQKGQRVFSGAEVPDGLTSNQKFPEPILTPTTKDENDSEITEKEIITTGLVDEKTYRKMKEISLKLFKFGSDFLEEKGIILVDTKYEFGFYEGELILMDEIHTPDSSRFWKKDDYDKSPEYVVQADKEFVRQWMLKNKIKGKTPDILPKEVIEETSKRYKEIFKDITGEELPISNFDVTSRIYQNLLRKGYIKHGYVAMIMGSKSDIKHADKIKSHLEKFDIDIEMRVISAHKNGERLVAVAEQFNHSIEPIAVIAIAGRSNGLGGALAANLNVPVINCPPFSDKTDIMLNINSSLIMPSNTPAVTTVHPDNAALAAIRSLNIPQFKQQMAKDIHEMKEGLIKDDGEIRN